MVRFWRIIVGCLLVAGKPFHAHISPRHVRFCKSAGKGIFGSHSLYVASSALNHVVLVVAGDNPSAKAFSATTDDYQEYKLKSPQCEFQSLPRLEDAYTAHHLQS